MSRLKIKSDNGWFAATAGWQAAVEKLSDGAFKLFVHISLGADRSTGRFLFRQQDVARALRKSRRSIGTYLQELEERQVCRVRRSPNQHAPGVLEIADQYWPYQRSLSADSLSSTRSAQTLYVETIGEMLLERPCIRCRYSTSDRRLAAQWFQQGIELEDVRQSIFWAADASTSPGSTDSRASPSVPCITSVPSYRRSRAASFPPAIGLSIECKCCDWKNAGSKQTTTATRKEEPAWEKFSQAQPPKIKRNEMMMIPKWGNYPGDGGGGITLVIDRRWLRTEGPVCWFQLEMSSLWPLP